MFTRPADLADDVASAAVQKAWQLRIRRIDYAPVGFGSYHWHSWADEDRLFVTADDLVTGGSHLGTSPTERAKRMAAALASARVLRDAGLTFVVAPIPTADGEILQLVEERWAVALYPFVDGSSSQWGVYQQPPSGMLLLNCWRRCTGRVDVHVIMPGTTTSLFHKRAP